MLRRLIPAVLGLATVIVLGGCTVHGHGPRVDQDPKRHRTAVYNIRQRSYPHAHYGRPVHAHSDGDEAHSHGTQRTVDEKKRGHDYPPRHRGYHEQGEGDRHENHGKRKGHNKNRD